MLERDWAERNWRRRWPDVTESLRRCRPEEDAVVAEPATTGPSVDVALPAGESDGPRPAVGILVGRGSKAGSSGCPARWRRGVDARNRWCADAMRRIGKASTCSDTPGGPFQDRRKRGKRGRCGERPTASATGNARGWCPGHGRARGTGGQFRCGGGARHARQDRSPKVAPPIRQEVRAIRRRRRGGVETTGSAIAVPMTHRINLRLIAKVNDIK